MQNPAQLAELLSTGSPGVELLTKSFRALGDPTRLRLLLFLLDGERAVGECVAHVGLSQGRVSTHLACLADCGFVQSRRAKRFVYYQVTDPRIVGLIELMRSVAADNSAALARCLRIDERSGDEGDEDPHHPGDHTLRPDEPGRSTPSSACAVNSADLVINAE